MPYDPNEPLLFFKRKKKSKPEPAIIQMPKQQPSPITQLSPNIHMVQDNTQPFKEQEYDVRKTLYIKLEGNRVPLNVIEWLSEHTISADYEFATYDAYAVIHYFGDGEKPPVEWTKKPKDNA
jgi:hypothetical protein